MKNENGFSENIRIERKISLSLLDRIFKATFIILFLLLSISNANADHDGFGFHDPGYNPGGCTANNADIFFIDTSNVTITGQCDTPLSTVLVSGVGISFEANGNNVYDMTFGYGNGAVDYDQCMNDIYVPNLGTPSFTDKDGDSCPGVATGSGTFTGTINNLEVSCDPDGDGFINSSSDVNFWIGWDSSDSKVSGTSVVRTNLEHPQCYGEASAFTLPVAPTINFNKISVGEVGTFNFITTNVANGNFDLTTLVQNVAVTSGDVIPASDGSDGFSEVVVQETIPVGWSTSISCSGGSSASFLIDNATGAVTMPVGTLAANDVVECTVTNTKLVSELSLTKTSDYLTSGDTDGSGDLSVGDVITYTMTATNSGATILTNVTISDNFIAGALSCTPANGSTLAIGASLVCEGTYTVVTGDVGNTITNTASATSDQDDAPDATVNNPVASPGLDIVKTNNSPAGTGGYTDADGSGDVSVGDTITYTYTVTNTGTAILTGVTVVDDLLGSVTLSNTTIAVGGSVTGTLTYTILASDLDSNIVNIATADSDQTGEDTSTNTIPVAAPLIPSLAIIKSLQSNADEDGNGQVSLNDTLTYSVSAINDGQVVLTNVSVSDSKISPSSKTCPSLAIGASCTLTGSYTVTASDVQSGRVINNATANSNETPPVTTSVTVIVPLPSIAIVKTLTSNNDVDGSGNVSVGDTLTYTITATNDGQAILTNVIVNDPQLTPTSKTCPILSVGAKCILEGTYKIVLADAAAGEFTNTATANSTQVGPVSDSFTVIVVKQPLKISGVVYGSDTRDPLEAVTLQLLNSSGNLVDASCLGADQQNQVTEEDGFYVFDILPSAHESCAENDTYTIKIVTSPEEYFTGSSLIPVEATNFDSDVNETVCTLDVIDNSLNCEVQKVETAPQEGEDTTYYMEFILHSDDNDVIFNHIPLDPDNRRDLNENSILLSKSVNKKQASIADQLYYTLLAENLVDVDIIVDIRDDLPTGFKMVYKTAKLTRTGPDNQFGTADDIVSTIPVTGYDPVSFGPLALDAAEKIQIGYLLKVGTGVHPGTWTNTAQAFDSGTTIIASNIATAKVVIVADPVLDDATLIGKVFHDRDGDGYQDDANATGITVKSNYFGWNSLHLGGLTGRRTVLDNPAKHSVTVRMPYSANNSFKVTTQQGTVINVNQKGQASVSHIGAKAKGLTAQDIKVTTRRVKGSPTPTNVAKMRVTAVNRDVLAITITNYGIHEEGIPGVRLATVRGLVIETDGHGRYHIPDVSAGRRGWGQNFIIKVDKVTLPRGAKFTTENPRVLRITGAALNKINFGVKLPVQAPPARRVQKEAVYQMEDKKTITRQKVPVYKSVDVNLGSIFFDKDKHHIRADQRGNMDLIAKQIRQYGRGHIIIDAYTDSRHRAKYNVQLARRRAFTVRSELQKRLGKLLMNNVKVEVDPRAFKQVPHNDPRSIDYQK